MSFQATGPGPYRRLAVFVAVACLSLVTAPFAGAADSKPATNVNAGTLTCKSKGGIGLIIASKTTLNCTYKPAGKGMARQYTGTVTKIGIDIGIKGPTTVVWGVLASSVDLPEGALQGNYAGVSASAAVGIGVGANALVGGSSDSVVLQPLSVQGQTGLSIAAGVTGLKLKRN